MRLRPKFPRRKLLVDKKMQLSLIMYSLVMTAAGVIMAGALSSFVAYASYSTGGPWSLTVGLLVCTSVAFLGTVLLILVVSNRIAGPLYRLRRVMLEVAQGADPIPLTVRKGDLTEELFKAYNQLITRIPSNEEK